MHLFQSYQLFPCERIRLFVCFSGNGFAGSVDAVYAAGKRREEDFAERPGCDSVSASRSGEKNGGHEGKVHRPDRKVQHAVNTY